MKAITAKKVFMFVIAVFSMGLIFGCANMMHNTGCQKGYAAQEEKGVILAFEDIHFNFDKSTLTPEAKTILNRNIKILQDNPNAHVRIAGYTSASGTEEYNQKLSERRAKAVEDYLINVGHIAPDRLTRIGYGESDPAMHEAAPKELYSKAAKANMRVLFQIVVE
jgi:OmpA-OmpF porin, OOP family